MSAVSIIAMKIVGRGLQQFRVDRFASAADRRGSEMLSTPPATTQSAPSSTIVAAAMAMVCRPEEQKRLTVTPPVVIGRPASSAACGRYWARRARTLPMKQSSTYFLVDAGALDGVLDGVGRHATSAG